MDGNLVTNHIFVQNLTEASVITDLKPIPAGGAPAAGGAFAGGPLASSPFSMGAPAGGPFASTTAANGAPNAPAPPKVLGAFGFCSSTPLQQPQEVQQPKTEFGTNSFTSAPTSAPAQLPFGSKPFGAPFGVSDPTATSLPFGAPPAS